jgi:thioredoxin-like negative regulator of GroEL
MDGRLLFLSVDVDAEPALASRFGVLSIPTLKCFRAGREVASHVGAPGSEALRRLLTAWAHDHHAEAGDLSGDLVPGATVG